MQSLESQVRGLQDDLFAAQEELQVTMEKHEQVRSLNVTQSLQRQNIVKSADRSINVSRDLG